MPMPHGTRASAERAQRARARSLADAPFPPPQHLAARRAAGPCSTPRYVTSSPAALQRRRPPLMAPYGSVHRVDRHLVGVGEMRDRVAHVPAHARASASNHASSSRSATTSRNSVARRRDRRSSASSSVTAATGAGCGCAPARRDSPPGAASAADPAVRRVVEVLRDLFVDVVAEHLAQLGLHRLVDGLATGERLVGFGAPPREFLAAFAPAVAPELGEHRRRRLVLLVALDRAQRQLPAHRRLGLAEVLAGVHRVQVQTRSRGRPRSRAG